MNNLDNIIIQIRNKVDEYYKLYNSQYYTKLIQGDFIRDCYLLSNSECRHKTIEELKGFIESVFNKNLPVNFQIAPHPENPLKYMVFCNTVKIFEVDFFNKTYLFLLIDKPYDERIKEKQEENAHLTAEIQEVLSRASIDIDDLDNIKKISDVSLAIPIIGKRKRADLANEALKKREICTLNNAVISSIKKEKAEMYALRESLQDDIETCIVFL